MKKNELIHQPCPYPDCGSSDAFKVCSKCKTLRSTVEYHKDKLSKDGLFPQCKSCRKEYSKTFYSKNKKKIAEYRKTYCEDNKEKLSSYFKEYNRLNKDKIRVRMSEYHSRIYADDIRRKSIAEKNKDWKSRNKDRVLAQVNKRRSLKVNATPIWLSEKHLQEIKNVYWLAKDLNNIGSGKYEVDHIVPLKSKTVCGLHVPWNLQILPSDVNGSKGNKFNDWT